MKKFIIALAVVAAFAATAALTTAGIRAEVAFPSASVSAGGASTNVVQVSGLRGLGEVFCTVGSVASASSNRTVTVYLDGTNTVSGGWSLIGAGSYKGSSAGFVRVQCQADYLPPTVRVRVENTTAASVVAGSLLAY